MAQIKDVTLQIKPGSSNDNKEVTVGFKLAFSTTEAGKSFRYDISLRGEDLPGDKESPIIIGEEVLSDFSFGAFGLFIGFPSKLITAKAGEQQFTEIRNISTKKLNEDPGGMSVTVNGLPLELKHADEIFAEATLMKGDQITLLVDKKRSNTVTGFFG